MSLEPQAPPSTLVAASRACHQPNDRFLELEPMSATRMGTIELGRRPVGAQLNAKTICCMLRNFRRFGR